MTTVRQGTGAGPALPFKYGEDLIFYEIKPESFTAAVAGVLDEELPSEALEAESQELLILRRVVADPEENLDPLTGRAIILACL